MPDITIIQPGMFTTVQDLGRKGLQQYGVPVSGAMDEFSLRVANKLLQNDEGAAALEVTIIGPAFTVSDATAIAVTGAEVAVKVNGKQVPMWQTVLLKSGDTISIGAATRGARAYIGFAGGIDVPVIMGSRSTFVRGAIGGVEGRTLRTGDIVPIGQPRLSLRDIAGNFVPKTAQPVFPSGLTEVRILLGPQDDSFPADAMFIFERAVYSVSNESDRMGFRLDGPVLVHRDKADIVSDGIAPGSIQVPGHGQPIVMLADRQTTGGYTKIGTVITADLPLMGQLKPKDELKFVIVDLEQAMVALKKQRAAIETLPLKSSQPRMFNINLGGMSFVTEVREVLEEGDE